MMKQFFAQLRPMERRLAVGVLVVLIIVLNALFIWPHLSDWGKYNFRLKTARAQFQQYQAAIGDTAKFQGLVNTLQSQGQFVSPEEQAINFMRTVQAQANSSGFGIGGYGRATTRTNQFFSELSQSISVTATDAQLIDFLYKLGSSASMVRVRELDLQPDAPHQHLNANITLVASYQKKPTTAPAATAPTATPPAAKPAATRPPIKPANAKSK